MLVRIGDFFVNIDKIECVTVISVEKEHEPYFYVFYIFFVSGQRHGFRFKTFKQASDNLDKLKR